MNHINKIFLVLIAIIIVLSGCNGDIPNDFASNPFMAANNGPEAATPVANDRPNRFGSGGGGDNFEGVRVWADKYKELKKQNDQLKKRNDELTKDNNRVMGRFDSMKVNLETAEKELTDANELLIEMRKELDGWKVNVLGHRQELDHVHKEQLQALVKILKLLGAESEDIEMDTEE